MAILFFKSRACGVATWLAIAGPSLGTACREVSSRLHRNVPAVDISSRDPDPSRVDRRVVDKGGFSDSLRFLRAVNDSAGFKGISSIAIDGERIWVTARLMTPQLTVLDIQNGVVLSRSVLQGNEEDQARRLGCLRQADGVMTAFDLLRQRLIVLRAGDDGGVHVASARQLIPDIDVQCAFVQNGHVFGSGDFADHSLLEFGRDGKAMTRHSSGPPFSPVEMPHFAGRRALNASFSATVPGSGNIILAYKFATRLDWFSRDGLPQLVVEGPHPVKAAYRWIDGNQARGSHRSGELAFEPSGELAYLDLAATKRRVYALFCGCPLSRPRATSLFVFSSTGDFLGELKFDRPVWRIAIDPDESIVVAAIRRELPSPSGDWREHLAVWRIPMEQDP